MRCLCGVATMCVHVTPSSVVVCFINNWVMVMDTFDQVSILIVRSDSLFYMCRHSYLILMFQISFRCDPSFARGLYF